MAFDFYIPIILDFFIYTLQKNNKKNLFRKILNKFNYIYNKLYKNYYMK